MAFFRKIFDEVATKYTEVKASYEYVDAAALKLVISPWQFDVMVTENMFGDILSEPRRRTRRRDGYGRLRRIGR